MIDGFYRNVHVQFVFCDHKKKEHFTTEKLFARVLDKMKHIKRTTNTIEML